MVFHAPVTNTTLTTMTPDPTRTIPISDYHCIEVGAATWNPEETSIRSRYDAPDSGRFSPHASSELPLEDLLPIMQAAGRDDLLDSFTCARIISALAASIERQSHTSSGESTPTI
jgi:hypothetical protein